MARDKMHASVRPQGFGPLCYQGWAQEFTVGGSIFEPVRTLESLATEAEGEDGKETRDCTIRSASGRFSRTRKIPQARLDKSSSSSCTCGQSESQVAQQY